MHIAIAQDIVTLAGLVCFLLSLWKFLALRKKIKSYCIGVHEDELIQRGYIIFLRTGIAILFTVFAGIICTWFFPAVACVAVVLVLAIYCVIEFTGFSFVGKDADTWNNKDIIYSTG